MWGRMGVLIISITNPRVWRELPVARPRHWVLAGSRWGGGGVSRLVEGSGG